MKLTGSLSSPGSFCVNSGTNLLCLRIALTLLIIFTSNQIQRKRILSGFKLQGVNRKVPAFAVKVAGAAARSGSPYLGIAQFGDHNIPPDQRRKVEVGFTRTEQTIRQ
jgi:hypothetical protein